MEKTLKFVSGRSAQDLELCASVHFLAKMDHDGNTVVYVHKILKDLKPDTCLTLKDVDVALGVVLENNNIA